jgi:hypothetical protein
MSFFDLMSLQGLRSMKLIPILLMAGFCCAADPVILHVQVHENRYLTFSVENKYTSPITSFEVAVDFPDAGGLGCGVKASVKRPEDLSPSATCGIPASISTGKPDRPWRARMVSVEFADGMRWVLKQR